MKSKKLLFIAIPIVIALIIAGIIIVPAVAQQAEIREQIELGDRYLAELDYDNAVLAYQRVLEIDPHNEAAIKGLTDTYHALIHMNEEHGHDDKVTTALSELEKWCGVVLYTSEVTREATCGVDGVRTYGCTLCDATYTEAIAATGAHTWDSGAVTLHATITAEGVRTYTCANCGGTRTEAVAKLAADDIVTDAINYSREIIPVFDRDGFDYDHIICIPKINLSTENAQNFNDKIYNDHAGPYEALLNYSEEHFIYHIDYTYKVYEDVVAIRVELGGGVQGGGGSFTPYYYYYDIKNDREIRLDEYIGALGYATVKELETTLKSMQDISDLGDDIKIDGCLADEESTLVLFTNANAKWGRAECEFEPVVKKAETTSGT